MGSAITAFILIVIGAGLYFVPTMVAADRGHQTKAVLAINFFLGWTLIGWVVALAIALWSTSSPVAPPQS